jgi:hypothetical protein
LAVAAWTAVVLGGSLLLALAAVVALDRAQMACFMGYPAVPCPGNDDPAVEALAIAFFGLPAAWLAGTVVAVIVFLRRQRREASAE